MRNRELIKNGIILIILFLLQFTIAPLIAIDSVTPNFLILFIVYYSFKLPKIYSILLGFSIGLIYDLFQGGAIGASAFGMTLAAYIVTFFPTGYFDSEKFSLRFLMITFLSSTVYSFFSLLLAGEVPLTIIADLIFFAFLSGIFTTAFAVPLIFVSSEKILNE